MNTFIDFVYGYLFLWLASFAGLVSLLLWNRRLDRRLKSLEDETQKLSA